jgi:hypothetical protein
MNFEACFRFLADRLREEIIVTSAGNCSELWWEITRESERVFYLEASNHCSPAASRSARRSARSSRSPVTAHSA